MCNDHPFSLAAGPVRCGEKYPVRLPFGAVVRLEILNYRGAPGARRVMVRLDSGDLGIAREEGDGLFLLWHGLGAVRALGAAA